MQATWDRDGADAALSLHLRNVIPVTSVTPRGDGLWSIDAHAIAVGAGMRGTGTPLITSLCTISDRIGVNRSRPDRDY